MDGSDRQSGKKRGFFRLFGRPRDPEELENTTEEEIMSMVEEGHERGVLQESEAQMIHNVLEFDDKDARDIMTHRKNIAAVEGHMTLEGLLDFVKDQEFSRYPVYLETIDNITGIIHIRDLLQLVRREELLSEEILRISGLVRRVPFIPETRHINDLFHTMQSEKNHMVIVIDEYGQTAGLVTMEDILEELVGNILDEYDREESLITHQKDGSYLMDGETEIDEVCDTLEIDEEELDDFDTLNGFIVSRIDRIPEEGEVYSIREFGWLFEVLKVENKMVRTVRVTRLPQEKEPEAPAEE